MGKMFSGWSLALRLAAPLALLAVAIALVGVFGIQAVREAQHANTASLQLQRDLKDTLHAARTAGSLFRGQGLDFRYLLLRGEDRADYERYLSSFHKRGEEFTRQLAQVQEVMVRVGLPADGVEDARKLHVAIIEQHLEALKLFDPTRMETARVVDEKVRGKNRQLDEKIELIVNLLQAYADSEAVRLVDQSVAESRRAVSVLGSAVAVLVLFATALGWLIVQGVRRELGGEPSYAKQVASSIAAGDLATPVRTRRGDASSLLAAMGLMQRDLRSVVGEVVVGAHRVSQSSSQIALANRDLSERTEQQASTLEETASAMEELASTVTQNADNARTAARLAGEAAAVATRGGGAVRQVVGTMEGIAQSSRKIADIIGVIDAIAFQTNILALNAAVEAARAGEQGRGFAVVAAEVRGLAQRSASAAREIKDLIAESVGKVDAGSSQVNAAGATMEEIVAAVQRVSGLIAEIAAASEEQRSGLEQVNTAVGQMDRVVQKNAAMVDEATAATDTMRQQAEALVQLMGRFRVDAQRVRTQEQEDVPMLATQPQPLIAA